eukprot:TRINITY_DN90574_c0_g1_i1.p1 TRINITY_DN90574_c0_g1~~TRINITY_DN90574_c0_g1_i1.p1  ORF type:complete len:175 (+),score=60.09 TRINITY_DN90574_c0_g1_i1:481-1005(+)
MKVLAEAAPRFDVLHVTGADMYIEEVRQDKGKGKATGKGQGKTRWQSYMVQKDRSDGNTDDMQVEAQPTNAEKLLEDLQAQMKAERGEIENIIEEKLAAFAQEQEEAMSGIREEQKVMQETVAKIDDSVSKWGTVLLGIKAQSDANLKNQAEFMKAQTDFMKRMESTRSRSRTR